MSRACLRGGALLVALAATAPLAAAGAPAPKVTLDDAFRVLSMYDWGQDLKVVEPLERAILTSKGDAAVRKEIETRLLAVLGSNAPRGAKDYVCRKLCLIGTAASVPALAALLPDKDLSHMARYALERMPYPEAGKALRDALPKASGRTQVGIINSLGVREDTEAVGALIGLLKSEDPEIVAAAAFALGRAGTPEAARAVADFAARPPKGLESVAVDASLSVAQRLLRRGSKDEAAKIYEALDAEGQPPYVRLAAFQGLVAVRPAESAPRLLKALAGEGEALRTQAALLIAGVPGEEATRTFADALAKLPPAGQVALLGALAMRGDTAARPAILEAVRSADPKVRAAAVAALGATGNASDVVLLAGIAASDDKEAAAAAPSSLARLKGEGVDETIVAALRSGSSAVRPALIRSLAARGAKACVGAVAERVGDPEAKVRLAALEALGELGGAEQAATAVKALSAARDATERDAAGNALSGICSRAREAAAEPVIAGLDGADAPSRLVLLRALGRAGGAKALAAVRAAVSDKQEPVRDEAVRVLAGWPDPSAAELLLELARTAQKPAYQVLALNGYVRLAGLSEGDDAKMKMLAQAMELVKRPDEKKLLLSALGGVHTPESLQRILPYLGDPALIEEASLAAVQVARDVAGKDKDLVREAMTKVTQESKNKRTRQDAAKILGEVKK